MRRFLLAAVIAAGAVTAAVPASAKPEHPIVRDRVEDRLDRIENRIDHRHTWGVRDRVEDRIDRREDRFDRRHDGGFTAVDRWGWHHPRW